MSSAQCTIHNSQYRLHSKHFTLHTTHCPVHSAHNTHYTVHTIHTTQCTQYTLHSRDYTVHMDARPRALGRWRRLGGRNSTLKHWSGGGADISTGGDLSDMGDMGEISTLHHGGGMPRLPCKFVALCVNCLV